jgi:hypothetical protein
MLKVLLASLSFSLALVGSCFAQTDVLTQHNDSMRTGANITESKLSPASVSPYLFGLLYKLPVDGQVIAQPLVVSHVSVPGHGVVDLAYVVTLHDSVYCFMVTPRKYSLLWQVSLGASVPSGDTNSGDIWPEIGIVATPVIDRQAGIIYVVAKTKEAGPTYFSRIHALNLTSGTERAGSPVAIQGSVPGTAVGSSGGVVTFDPLLHMSRPGLLLDHGNLYIGFGSHGDNGNYHGWVFAYDATSLNQKGIFCSTPNGDPNYYIPSGAGGIWMAGNGLAADPAGNIYFMSGNGTVSHDGTSTQTGNSIVKLTLGAQGLSVADFFAPYDSDNMNWADADLGSAGIMLVPGMNMVFGGGKTGDFFVINTQSMGHIGTTSDSIIQRFYGTAYGLFTSPVGFKMQGVGWTVFLGGYGDIVRAYKILPNKLVPLTVNAFVGGQWPGSSLAISSSGQTNGIVWALCPDNNGNALLRALQANNLRNVLWDSGMQPGQTPGIYSTFAVPTVANGLVYVPTFSGTVAVYGLKPGTQRSVFAREKPPTPTITKLGPPNKSEKPGSEKP